MKAAVIKFANGIYYAGSSKKYAKTLLGAQLYKSRKTAETIMNTSINFPYYYSNPCEIVEIELKEVK